MEGQSRRGTIDRTSTKVGQQASLSELSTFRNLLKQEIYWITSSQAYAASLEGDTSKSTQSVNDVAIHAKKKTKTSRSEARAEDANAKLCIFTGMPLDILYEICHLLQPADLVSLCDASALVWRTLCTKSATNVWLKSREAEGVYEIPDGVNEYHWAKLLFSTRCMECNADGVFFADFNLRRRICDTCKPAEFINIERFKKHFGEDITVLTCVPFTWFEWASQGRPQKAYWRPDVVQQLTTLSALNQDVNSGRKGAYDARERYKATRSRLLRFINTDAAFFDQWQKARASNFSRQRYEEITKRFVRLGYRIEDLPRMREHPLLNQPVMLTDNCWKSIQNEFEPVIRATSEARASERRMALIFARRKLLDKVYASHKLNKFLPSLWRSLPQIQSLLKMQHFNDLIECDSNRELTREDFAPLMEMLDELVVSSCEEAKIHLREQVLAANDPLFSKRVSSTKEFKSLELAALVFSCRRCKLFYFGWDDIRSHYCGDKGLGQSTERYRFAGSVGFPEVTTTLEDLSGEFPHAFEYCAEGVAAVSLILKVLGLNPKSTTTSQLDVSDPRFLCGNMNHKEKSCKPHTAFNWRSFASHLITCHRRKIEQNKMPPPSLMTDDSTRPSLQDVRKREADIALEHGQWACAHCPKNLNAGCLQDIETVRKHVHATHQIPYGEEGIDLIDMSGYRLLRALACGVYINYAAKWYGNGY